MAELLVYYQPLEYSGCRSSTKCDVFIVFFRSVGRNFRCKRVIKFLRRLKDAHLRFLNFKNLKILKKRVRVNNCKFAKDSSIRATLFKGKVQQCVGKSLEPLFALISVRILLKQLHYSLSISMGRYLIRASASSTIKQMVNDIACTPSTNYACTIELWYTREVAKHERSVRVARGDSRVRL